jgi:hypothetical protein
MSAINRNLRHSSRSQSSSVGLERSRKLLISSNNVSRLLAFVYQISADNFNKIKSFSTSCPFSLCCKCSPISSERSRSIARRRSSVETFGLWQCCAGWFAELSASLSPVHSSRSPAYTSLRSFHIHSRQFSLAAINWANSVQAGEHRLQLVRFSYNNSKNSFNAISCYQPRPIGANGFRDCRCDDWHFAWQLEAPFIGLPPSCVHPYSL